MKTFISKLWKMNIWAFLGIFALIFFLSKYYQMTMLLNSLSLQTSLYSISINLTKSTGVGAIAIMSVGYTALVYVALRVYYILFVKIYVRTYGTKFAVVNAIPLDKQTFYKFILMFMSVAYFIAGFFRIAYFFNPMLINLFEIIIVPIINLGVAILAFFTLRKYFLEGYSSYNVFVALAIPFLVPDVISIIFYII